MEISPIDLDARDSLCFFDSTTLKYLKTTVPIGDYLKSQKSSQHGRVYYQQSDILIRRSDQAVERN